MATVKTSIQPWLSVLNSETAGTFYKQAFGAVETYRLETPGGGLVLKLTVDEAEFWVSGQSVDNDEAIASNPKQELIKLILVVDNPHDLFRQAIEAGATEVFPVGEGHGWILGRLSDPFGLDWEIGKPLTA